MKDRNLFMETLREVKEIVRTSERPLTRDEIMVYFKDIKLSDEQEKMIIEYLYTEEEAPAAVQEEEPEIIELPDETDEMLPEDMLTEEEVQIETETEVKLEEEQIAEILSGVQLDLEDYKGMYESLSSLAKEAEKSVATVTSVTSDVDWFNNTYENKGVTSGHCRQWQ